MFFLARRFLARHFVGAMRLTAVGLNSYRPDGGDVREMFEGYRVEGRATKLPPLRCVNWRINAANRPGELTGRP